MRISALIISYNPDVSRFYDVIFMASRIFDEVYVFDNASVNFREVDLMLSKFKNVSLYSSNVNVGISGLNFLADKAFCHGSDAISIVDQDSVLPETFRCDVMRFFSLNDNAVCAPVHIDINRSDEFCFRYKFTKWGIGKKKLFINNNIDEYIETDLVIGSGMTIAKKLWKMIGGFDSHYFIDCADFDFCIRLRKNNIRIFLMTGCAMRHEIGQEREKVIFFRVSMHKPIRHYYYFYSVLSLISKASTPIGFRVSYLLKLVVQYIVYSFLIADSKLHRKEINRAILEFIRDEK